MDSPLTATYVLPQVRKIHRLLRDRIGFLKIGKENQGIFVKIIGLLNITKGCFTRHKGIQRRMGEVKSIEFRRKTKGFHGFSGGWIPWMSLAFLNKSFVFPKSLVSFTVRTYVTSVKEYLMTPH